MNIALNELLFHRMIGSCQNHGGRYGLLQVQKKMVGFRDAREIDLADSLPPPPNGNMGAGSRNVDLILIEERRNYAAHGRERGGLGSLNVTIQSEPKFWLDRSRKVPALLWNETQAKAIESPNIALLLKLHAALDCFRQRLPRTIFIEPSQ